MKLTCTRRIQWSSGHRIFKHESKCANLHGHNYVAYFTASPKEGLDTIGRVVDFSTLKEKIGNWIIKNWDHSFLVYEKDKELITALEKIKTPSKPFICPFNPTAEEMAKFLLRNVCPTLFVADSFFINKVVLYETENCYACAEI